jgi:parvulin-like peptidyl-prolyl isomerase
MKRRFLLVLLLLPAVLALTACGSSSNKASFNAGDIAVVGATHVLKTKFDELMSEAQANYKLQGQTWPKAGSTEYSTIRSQAVAFLVQQAETEAEATKLGISVSNKDVADQLTSIKKQCCAGSESKYKSELKKQGLTDQEVRDNARSIVLSRKLANKLTAGIVIAPSAIQSYYLQHQSEFQKPASRAVRYILLGKKKGANTLAGTLQKQLTGASDSVWCSLAKKYSQDPSSKNTCGKATFTKGQTVPEFDKAAFSLPTKKVETVDSKQYGWFVLQPTAAPTVAKTTPVAQASASIKQTLLQTKKQAVITSWTKKTQKTYCNGQISYQPGYAPIAAQDPCQTTTSTTTATTG